MTFSQAQLHAAEAFILKNRKNLEDKDSTIPREVWLVAAAMQEERERCANQIEGIAGMMSSGAISRLFIGAANAIRSPSSDPKRQDSK